MDPGTAFTAALAAVGGAVTLAGNAFLIALRKREGVMPKNVPMLVAMSVFGTVWVAGCFLSGDELNARTGGKYCALFSYWVKYAAGANAFFCTCIGRSLLAYVLLHDDADKIKLHMGLFYAAFCVPMVLACAAIQASGASAFDHDANACSTVLGYKVFLLLVFVFNAGFSVWVLLRVKEISRAFVHHSQHIYTTAVIILALAVLGFLGITGADGKGWGIVLETTVATCVVVVVYGVAVADAIAAGVPGFLGKRPQTDPLGVKYADLDTDWHSISHSPQKLDRFASWLKVGAQRVVELSADKFYRDQAFYMANQASSARGAGGLGGSVMRTSDVPPVDGMLRYLISDRSGAPEGGASSPGPVPAGSLGREQFLAWCHKDMGLVIEPERPRPATVDAFNLGRFISAVEAHARMVENKEPRARIQAAARNVVESHMLSGSEHYIDFGHTLLTLFVRGARETPSTSKNYFYRPRQWALEVAEACFYADYSDYCKTEFKRQQLEDKETIARLGKFGLVKRSRHEFELDDMFTREYPQNDLERSGNAADEGRARTLPHGRAAAAWSSLTGAGPRSYYSLSEAEEEGNGGDDSQ